MVQQMAEPLLPPGSRVVPLAEAATLDENANGMFVTFGFALVIIFLVLAAQFESLISGLIIMSTVPLGLACAVFAMLLTGNTLNIYSQIGLVLLVGIMAKNGILIVEFANQLRDRGEDLRSAIENAANIRLRPVMMTMIATIVGAVPLVMASGAGAEARVALGWVLVGGPWPCHHRHALPDPCRLSGYRPVYQAACGRGTAAADRDAACRDATIGGGCGIGRVADQRFAVLFRSAPVFAAQAISPLCPDCLTLSQFFAKPVTGRMRFWTK